MSGAEHLSHVMYPEHVSNETGHLFLIQTATLVDVVLIEMLFKPLFREHKVAIHISHNFSHERLSLFKV